MCCICAESASLSSHFTTLFSHIKNRETGRGDTLDIFPSGLSSEMQLTWMFCLGGNSVFHSLLCLSLHLVQPSLWQSLFPPSRSLMITCETVTCRCVDGRKDASSPLSSVSSFGVEPKTSFSLSQPYSISCHR